MTGPKMTRRIAFQGLGALSVAAVLAGCGSGGGGDDDESLEHQSVAPPESGATLATTDEVPVGGGLVLADEGVVITQPTEGEFMAFTALCTHEEAKLDAVGSDGIECPLHGSRFSITDGSVTQGPATAALAAVNITVDGTNILAA